MDRIEVVQNFRKYVDLTDEEVSVFFNNTEKVKLKKNRYLFKKDDTDTPLALIKSGCLMTYYTDKDDNDHVLQFGQELWWTGDLHAFSNSVPSKYSIKAMSPTVVYLVSKSDFEKIVATAPSFERYFRIIFQNSLVIHQKRIIHNNSYTAEEKYKAFIKLYPEIELIVPQKYIASHLGITPEFLSKIRTRLGNKRKG